MAKDFLGAAFDGIFDERTPPSTEAEPEKGVPLRGRYLDNGNYYVRLADVCDLLKINGLLPKTEAILRRKVNRK